MERPSIRVVTPFLRDRIQVVRLWQEGVSQRPGGDVIASCQVAHRPLPCRASDYQLGHLIEGVHQASLPQIALPPFERNKNFVGRYFETHVNIPFLIHPSVSSLVCSCYCGLMIPVLSGEL